MKIELIKLLTDFGLVVLIWIVQLIIYPGFLHYEKANLEAWHHQYTPMITVIVLPLMAMQLILSGFILLQGYQLFNTINGILVLSTWILTMGVFVPLHGQISAGDWDSGTLSALVLKNWWRTAIWSSIFVLSLWQYLKK